MPDRPKILLLDDDKDLLEMYREMLGNLPSRPEIHTATSGARAIALLESEPFALLVSDLNMPRMDGLQVLTIVRRKFPHLRTAVMTSVVDPQFRARAYSMGIDLFLEKPNTSQEVELFMDCIESLLGQEGDGGFRGVQSKSLMDIIQLECLSHSSSVLKITNGPLVGKIWFDGGDVIDAETQDLKAEPAFHAILAWKTGAFEILPADPNRERVIQTSYQGLLLESAQAQDEAAGGETTLSERTPKEEGSVAVDEGGVSCLARFEGVEFVMAQEQGTEKPNCWGVEDPDSLSSWMKETLRNFRSLGERLGAGQLTQADCMGPTQHMCMALRPGKRLCVGFNASLSSDQMRETMEKVVNKWDS